MVTVLATPTMEKPAVRDDQEAMDATQKDNILITSARWTSCKSDSECTTPGCTCSWDGVNGGDGGLCQSWTVVGPVLC